MSGPLPHCDFRIMTRHELPEVLAIERRSCREPWDQDRFLEVVQGKNGCRCVVVEVEGKVIGYFVLELQATSTHIINLAIHPDYRRRGYASRCLGVIQKIALRTLEMAKGREANLHSLGSQTARGFPHRSLPTKELRIAEKAAERSTLFRGEIFLEVEESNLPAQLLYKKFGFRAMKILPNYYPTLQEDGYLMRQEI